MAKRIYTRTGDDGTTGIHGGTRVPKDDPRIEAGGGSGRDTGDGGTNSPQRARRGVTSKFHVLHPC